MTSLSNLFSIYTPCLRHQKVKIANESLSSIVGKGTIVISKKFILSLVLHVPNLSYNLISINKLTHDLNCYTKFSPTWCVFQKLCSGRGLAMLMSWKAYLF